MSGLNLNTVKYELSSLTVFRNILKTKVLSSFMDFLKCETGLVDKLNFYAEFVSELNADTGSFSDFLKKAVCEDENIYVTRYASNNPIAQSIVDNTECELEILSSLTTLSLEDISGYLSYGGYLPQFINEPTDFKEFYRERLKNVSKYGYGIFALKPMFRIVDGEIVPVKYCDEISVESFVGYEKERQAVIDNTVALIEGRPAANVLLYGDAGTGKSSTVKAVVNLLFDRGVRLIELRKDQLFDLSNIMGKIADNPLKFIIFIDDLSFNKNDDQFSMLKAALEGSASAKASNCVIYATSNRRHIVKESFSDRASADNDIHRNDTVQELLSLSDRFGLTIYFSKPNKILYLDIISQLASRLGVEMNKDELFVKAEAFALNKGSRSPRVAEQFIKSLVKK